MYGITGVNLVLSFEEMTAAS